MELADVGVTYSSDRGEAVEAVGGIDLTVRRGELLAIIGPSGCGKSSLLYTMGGMLAPSRGTIHLAGRPIDGPRPDAIGFVFQDYTLFPWKTVLHNVEFGLKLHGVDRGERRARALRHLDLVGLQQFTDAYPNELSGGMQQRVALARVLTMQPELLLLDEPFGALDEQTRGLLGDQIAEIIADTHKTAVLVTHSLTEAITLADRIVAMSFRPGRIKKILDVDEERPRRAAFRTSPHFAAIYDELYACLREEIAAAAEQELQRRIR